VSQQLRIGLIVASLAGVALLYVTRFAHRVDPGTQSIPLAETATLSATQQKRVVAFCSACHALPVPGSFARDAWHREVMQGYHFYAKSGRHDLDPPPPADAIAYFRSHAPAEVSLPAPADSTAPGRLSFRREAVPLESAVSVPPAVASLSWQSTGGGPRLLVADMRLGTVDAVSPGPLPVSRTALGAFGHPCHIETCDLDGDSQPDRLIADLGSFDPDDHDRGRVLWSRPTKTGDESIVLATGLGRVADVRAADLDRDGRMDLMVAEFGWQRTGGVHVYWGTGPDDAGIPQFVPQKVLSKTGAIHVPPVDLDGDGRLDLVALVSQEHESVVFLQNLGDRTWRAQTLWSAEDPAFGLSGMELVDLDGDRDLDILVTNGDTFDSLSVKPSHGVQWLRNEGGLRFTPVRIADLAGAYRALPADLDRDGDLDLAVSVWLPRQSLQAGIDVTTLPALVVYEQTEPLRFERRTLQSGQPVHAALEMGDFDADGDLDLVVGSFLTRTGQSRDWITFWWNETR